MEKSGKTVKKDDNNKLMLGIIGGAIVVLVLVLLLAKGCVKEYTVTFDSNGGSAVSAVKVKENETVAKPSDPTRAGYTFAGWFLDEKEYDFNSKVTKDITLKAHWNAGVSEGEMSLSTSTLNLSIGGVGNIDVVTLPDGYTTDDLIWTSSDTSVATVNNGEVKGLKVGTATIVITTKDGKYTATASVTVSEGEPVDVESVSIGGSGNVYVGSTLKLSVTVKPSNATDKSVTWTSSDSSIATVDKNGKVTGKKEGKVTITVTTSNGKTATKEVTVKERPAVSSVSISGSSSVNVGKTITLKATVKPSDAADRTVTWSVKNGTGSATIDKNGKLKGVKAGTVTVTAKTKNGKSASKTITVKDTWTVKFTAEKDSAGFVFRWKYQAYKNGKASNDYSAFKLGSSVVVPGGERVANQEIVDAKRPKTVTITLKNGSKVSASVTYA